jgi:anti-sigma regulatory factor (Ser/Thr protein kinase)
MSQLYIPNSVALSNFDSLFKDNDFDFTDKDVNIRFHPTYVAMHPVGLAFYAAIGDLFKLKEIKTKAAISYDIPSIPYLQRMGLFGALGYGNPVKTKEHEETGRFIPLMKIETSEELATFLKTVDPILHTTQENSRVIKHVFSELMRNVLEHSESRFGGNVCATFNKRRKKFSIGISDAGRGIFKAMRRYHKLENDKDAIIAALTPGISGTTSRLGGTAENAGAGLFFTKCIAQTARNHFLIYSGSAYFKLRLAARGKAMQFHANPLEDNCSIREDLPYFNGTLIGIDIYIQDTTAFNNLIETIGSAYRLSVKQSRKDYYKQIQFI